PYPTLFRSQFLQTEGWCASAELVARLAPHARRLDTVPAAARYDLLQRPSRVKPWRQLLEAWRARSVIRAARTVVAVLFMAVGLHAQSDSARRDSIRSDSTGVASHSDTATVTPAVAVPFPVGERLVYGARYGPFSVGTATMQVAGIDTIRGVETVHFVFLIDGGALWYHSAPPSIKKTKWTVSTPRIVSIPATCIVAVPTLNGP